jgi:tetratricopeptide (TPR) repeat protein
VVVDPLQQVEAVAQEHVGMSGNRFLNINLEIRSTQDAAAPLGAERRQLTSPETVEVLPQTSPLYDMAPASGEQQAIPLPTLEDASDGSYVFSSERVEEAVAPAASSALTDEEVQAFFAPEPAPAVPAAAAPAAVPIMAIVADKVALEPKEAMSDRKEYARKSDWLRAQFLPEVEALDFSGLFVGNLGLGVLEEKSRRNVVLADPARITEVLLRANGSRRTGDHAKALIGYQELVDMDPANADFRFLLGRTFAELGQHEPAAEAFLRAKELGHDGAEKELNELKRAGHRPKTGFGFLKFWKG